MKVKEIYAENLKSANINKTEKRVLDLERANKIYSNLRLGIKASCDIDIRDRSRKEQYVAARNKVANIMYESGCRKYHISKVMGFSNASVFRAISRNNEDTIYFSKKYPHMFNSIGNMYLSADDIARKYNIADMIIAMSNKKIDALEQFIKVLN